VLLGGNDAPLGASPGVGVICAPQLLQNVALSARLVPHFEQNTSTPCVHSVGMQCCGPPILSFRIAGEILRGVARLVNTSVSGTLTCFGTSYTSFLGRARLNLICCARLKTNRGF
jgi:hypothetical protein